MNDDNTKSGPLRVLVVDDEELNRIALETQFRGTEYEVLEASNGAEALDIVKKGDVDLVILDVVMPIMDGFETCRRIRRDMGNLTLPIVIITSLDDRQSRRRGEEAGCDDFLTKPVDPVEIKVRVRNLLDAKAYHELHKRQQELLEQEQTQIEARLVIKTLHQCKGEDYDWVFIPFLNEDVFPANHPMVNILIDDTKLNLLKSIGANSDRQINFWGISHSSE